jgi:hypothetical protein
MGEKGNPLDISEEVFAHLAEQGPGFWIAYEQYRLAGARRTRLAWRRRPGLQPRAAGPSDEGTSRSEG